MNLDISLASLIVDYFNRFHVRIEFVPLTSPVGTNAFFSNHTTAFRGLGPADILTHERQCAVNVALVEGSVSPRYQCLGVLP
jgi:hypothetical protein